MRMTVIRRPAAAARTTLALLVLAGAAATARAEEPPPPGVLVGTVVRADDGSPVPYAHVTEERNRVGATTDERGRFLLAGLPPGRLELRIQALGGPPLLESVEIAPGDTLRRTYRLPPTARERFQAARDSLAARGLWPPTLDPTLHAHMREALDVRVFRLDPTRGDPAAPPDRERWMGPWPIVGEARGQVREAVAALIEVLRHPPLYLPDLEGSVKECGGFSPGVGVRLNGTGHTTELLLCYACAEFSLWRDGRPVQSGDFEDREADFVAFARRMFPDDRAFRRLAGRPGRASR